MVDQNDSSKTIAVINVDPIDWHVIAQVFENHPERLTPVHVDMMNDIGNAGVIISKAPVDYKDIPTIILDQNPMRMGKIMDQIESILLRSDLDITMDYKGYHLDVQKSRLTIDGVLIDLTDRENHIMQALIKAGADGCGRPHLLQTVWGYRNDLDTHTLETHIYRLRQKIETDPAAPLRLITIPNGYRLV